MVSAHASEIPLFWGHGTSDPLVVYKFGTDSVELLTKKIGFTQSAGKATGLDFKSYEGMGHSSCQEELDDLSAWIKRVIPKVPE